MLCYHIAVCDDKSVETKYLSELASHWAGERGLSVQIDAFASAEQLLLRYRQEGDYDMLLLDIEMDGISGVELAKRIRAGNKIVQIVFVTGYSDYILDGYEVEALHYLMKPVSGQKLWEVLDRAVDRLRRSEKALLLNTGRETVRVPLHEIRWLEVRQNYVTVHAGSDYTVKKPLSELEQGLDGQFFRAGRSYIVNLKYVSKVSRSDVCLRDGALVPLSRGLYDAIHRAIIQNF